MFKFDIFPILSYKKEVILYYTLMGAMKFSFLSLMKEGAMNPIIMYRFLYIMFQFLHIQDKKFIFPFNNYISLMGKIT